MRAIVTGATGFLGGYLLKALLEEGVEPIALVRRASDVRLIDSLGVERRLADLRDEASLHLALRGGDLVINAAGKVTDWGSWREFYESNVRGTARLLSAALHNGIKRFVHISSISAYGMRFLGSQMLSEETSYRPSLFGRDFYCRSKYLSEEEVKRASGEKGIEHVIVRPSMLVGERDSSITRRIFSLIRGKQKILNVGRLEDRVQLTDGEDAAKGIVLAGLHGPPNETYNICCPPWISKSEFWSRALRGLGIQREIIQVPYPLALMAAWMTECAHLASGNGGPPVTVWSVYLMGNQNVVEGSKIGRLGWRPKEDLGGVIERAFRQYLRPQSKPKDETIRWQES
ncbi:MAG: NAD-dependent epimerase/dehydratase family protein [candidate division NC10 bacterium]|nr:NAD-dependent epimerase/dehydratase family protein [candidate division NC10 bacterium]